MRLVVKIVGVIAVILIILALMSNVLILAADATEGTPGVDMAALWSVGGGFQWIYPGSSHNAQGQTLHNIYLDSDEPYQFAKDIIEYTYHTSPNVCVVIDNEAAEDIFGDGLVDNIREKDWGEGYDRGVAVSMSISQYNVLQIIPNLLTGHIHIHLI
ncbi:MAG: hypothetical protein MJ203_02725 [archaeon]|nr:hypothetical protein [archaeon]